MPYQTARKDRSPVTGRVSSHPLHGTDLGILDTHSPQHKALQPLFPQQLHCELTILLGATAGPVLVADILYNEDTEINCMALANTTTTLTPNIFFHVTCYFHTSFIPTSLLTALTFLPHFFPCHILSSPQLYISLPHLISLQQI